MSYRFKLDVVLRFYMHGDASAINHNYEIACRCECREISSRESSSSEILRASVESLQECNQPVWQIVYMPCANPILRSTIPADGSASATPRDATQYARLVSGMTAVEFHRECKAFGDLARQPWPSSDGGKWVVGVCRRTRQGGFGYPLENGERVEVAMGMRPGWVPSDLSTSNVTRIL